MKKILIVLAAVAMAGATQAAVFSWKLSTGSTYASMKVYAISGTTSDAVLAAFSSTTATDWTSAVSGITPVTAGTGSRGVASSSIANVSDGDKIVFAIVNGDIAEGNNYYVTSEYTIPAGATYTPPDSNPATSFSVNLAGSGTFTAVPEPTSGLLMLLGMAGLALRRRRA